MEATNHKEVMLKGIGVSSGVATGPVFLLTTEEERFVERDIGDDEIAREIARFEEALIATRHQIHEIQKQVEDALGPESASIFDAHLLVVDDRALVEEVIRGLKQQKKNVESVLRVVAERYAAALLRVEDDYLRERAVDVKDVTRRILRNLSGSSSTSLAHLTVPHILVANDLAPSEAAILDKTKVLGFATDLGSPTSHTAIMARALGIPAVVGMHDISVRVSAGEQLLIDGNTGVVLIHPSREQLERYGKVQASRKQILSELERLKDEAAETCDGYTVALSCNIELPTDVESVKRQGGSGVGLFRTEYLYLAQKGLPGEDEQAEIYNKVAAELAPDPVVIRTLDLGGDKFLSQIKTPAEINPFMGWRAIRFCLAQPEIFKTQLRAMLRASVHENVKIMYPMISNLDEVLKANELLEGCKNELRAAGIPFNENVDVGVMIEVPSAALTAHLIAPHVSFFSLGTNDLVQYTLAVDRVNERIAYLYEPTHPAILRLIKNTIDVGHEHGIWTGICGEMAGNPLLVPLLVGMGADELSVSPSAIPVVKDVIRKLRYSQAEELAEAAMGSTSGTDVMNRCRDLVRDIAPEILELMG
ncbi:MAG TPA: phosphoenolpyruvate--protein phosphotransferase [Kiritimatiellia bacterium]|nr:phosphoenolpyruvate--protein phosphotransferase [Kiritimatiellia bacterium]HMO97625.1 phosphoenolpyruvate--protein phosphotransferase [Kiritimatiellia bacterium]HMP95985.1 phosphoenolpyruvate--protein phosphotransferase [Kiritimatiellia bacterium]